jgi:hypothetical protein
VLGQYSSMDVKESASGFHNDIPIFKIQILEGNGKSQMSN